MESEPIFLEWAEVLELHDQSLAEFGGSAGIRDSGLVESALASAKNTFFFGSGDLFDIAAAYAFHIAEAQAFLDGNKRTAIASAIAFLHLNGIAEVPNDDALYEAMIAVAKHRLDKLGLATIFRSCAEGGSGLVLEERPFAIAKKRERKDTKYTLRPGQTSIEGLPSSLLGVSGILPIPMILDLTVGEEIVLCWFDSTPSVHEFDSIKPFNLYLSTGLFRSKYGPLLWMVFFATQGLANSPFRAAIECFVNPASELQVATWRRLSRQTHCHLLVLDAKGQKKRFLEFENNFEIDRALELMEQACSGSEVKDFGKAKEEFSEAFTIETLLKLRL